MAALTTLLLLQPYLATQPEILLRTDFSNDFGYSYLVARGLFSHHRRFTQQTRALSAADVARVDPVGIGVEC
ncbi:MAG: hypothetical protein ACJ0UT_07335 [Candidatus Latescibacterota bacterium]